MSLAQPQAPSPLLLTVQGLGLGKPNQTLDFTCLLFARMWCATGTGPTLECGSIRTESISKENSRQVIMQDTDLLGRFAQGFN